ncbi:multiple sugar transport system substrate-binding protein [Allocatelliglobosispora scoriae]|uniref:Multiple sugar transport system substrate-binding protein n=1 Tax=Allocatelliglobosispora scoriae TaxID=643052 RepID=A0A841BSQ7_9ACTN|nr:ABC transporter substrate-binding protein [Allocatelliglobosispora scoriae]MBB5870219.1 multiple sugar transport system substrate-binding protein [Allocatelliglobosispora scoriae]
MHRALNRRATVLYGLTAALMTAAACTPAPAPAPIATPGVEPTGTVELWHFFTDREAKTLDETLAKFKAKYPKVTLTVKGGQDDAKVTTAIGAGTGPDVAISYSTDIVGKFCAAGAWVDLNPYLQRDGVDLNAIPAVARSYTEFRGKRCSMPFLADAYGFYVNKKLLAEAGIAEAPKTLAELSDAAKKLTKRKPDGTIERAGFLPLWGFYENSPAHMAPMVGAKWLNEDGTSAVGSDPKWQELLKWQKELVDWYGYDKLEKFRASLGDEWSADNAFHKGQVAMAIDGEWRMAFLKDQAPTVEFGVAPLPVLDASRAGAGYISGNVIGVSRTAKNPEAAWALIKFLTTETDPIVELSNGIRNVPTTTAALNSPQLTPDPNFKIFLDIFANPNSGTTPPSAIGPAYQETLQEFLQAYQSGSKKDLAAGLTDVDTRVDKMIKLAG